MPKLRNEAPQASDTTLNSLLDKVDVVGCWDWDVPQDVVVADALVASLFSVDPDLAEAGTSLQSFVAGVHPADRGRVARAIERCARDGGSYVAEYRVCSVDGQTRWILSRGRFDLDPSGRPLKGRGIIIDITPARMSESPFVTADVSAVDHPLERVADRCVAASTAIREVGDPHLQFLSDMLLLEVGRRLAVLDGETKRKLMN